MTDYRMNHWTPDENASMLDAFDMSSIWANNNNNQTQTVPPTSSSASTSTVHQEFNQDTLQQRLQGLIDTARESWTYAIFWQSSVLEYSGPPILGWGDGYYKGEPNKPKTVMSATSLTEQQYRKKVLRELNSMISGTQAPENDAVDEEVTDTEWFFLISMTQSFVNGVGLPGQAMVTNQPVWVAGRERLMTSHCERARQGEGFGLQTIVCIPSADGVIELGSTELMYQSSDIMKKVRGSFNFNDQVRDPMQVNDQVGQGSSYNNWNLSHVVGGVSGQAPSISDMARGNMSSGGSHSYYSRDHSAPSWNALYIQNSSPMMTDSDSVHQFVGSEFGRNDFSEVSSKA